MASKENRDNAKVFLAEIKKARLKGNEFLALIGNTKISNEAFAEIRDNPNLTYERLIEIFEDSGLTAQDYLKIIETARLYSAKKNEMRRKQEDEEFEQARKQRRLQEEKLKQALNEANLLREKQRLQETAALERTARLYDTNAVHETVSVPYSPNENKEKPLHISPTYGRTAPLKIDYDAKDDDFSEYFNYDEENSSDFDDNDEIDDESEENLYSNDYENYDDFTDDDETFYNDDIYSDHQYFERKGNRPQTIASFFLAFILLAGSFYLRFTTTGNFFILSEKEIIYSEPATYQDLAYIMLDVKTRLSDDENVEANNIKDEPYYLSDDFYTSVSEKEKPQNKFLKNTEKYIFTVRDNSLITVNTKSGKLKLRKEYNRNDNAILEELILHDNYLYAVYRSEKNVQYSDMNAISTDSTRVFDENGEIAPVTAEGTFTLPITIVCVFSTESYKNTPIQEFQFDGEYIKTIRDNSALVFVTDYKPENPIAYNDLNAYIPSYKIGKDDENTHIIFSDIFIPSGTLKNTDMTALFSLSGENIIDSAAILGGDYKSVLVKNNALFVLQQEGKDSRIIKYDILNGILSDPVFTAVSGTMPFNSIMFFENNIFAVSVNETGSTLYAFTNELTQISKISEIAVGERLKASFLVEGKLYLVYDNIYIYDVTIPDDIIVSPTQNAEIYVDNYLPWNESLLLDVSLVEGENDTTIGLGLTMFRAENGSLTPVHTYLAEGESVSGANWQTSFTSRADDEKTAVYYDSERGIIALPYKYFNGISEIEKFAVLSYSDHSGFSLMFDPIVYYDWNKTFHESLVIDEYLFTFWDENLVASKLSDGAVTAMLNIVGEPLDPVSTPAVSEVSISDEPQVIDE